MQLETLLGDIAKARVAVVGDICVDAYVFLAEGRGEISVETGLKTRAVERYTFDLGGAGNVAINLKRLGAKTVDLFGIVGDDAYGALARDLLRREGVSADGVATGEAGWSTHVYCKIYERGREEPRLDYGNFNVPRRGPIDGLLGELERRLEGYDAVVINQQVLSGFQDEYFQERLQALLSRRPEGQEWVCDCRSLNDAYGDCIHKLNVAEARRIYEFHRGEGSSSGVPDVDLALWLSGHWGRAVMLTRGQDGAIAVEAGEAREILGLHLIDQTDAVGAGDAFLAAAVACLASGGCLADAAELGNLAAGVSVQKLFQTGHPWPAEILKLGASPDYRYNPELAADPRKARFLPGTEVEIIARPSAPRPGAVIFDHDGSISTLRQGWEGIMSRVMSRCILGDEYGRASPSAFGAVEAAVMNLIERTTGVQTLVQMRALCKLVADFGYVREIRTPAEYKAMYNEELLELIGDRLGRIRRGALKVEDYTIKGSVDFLRRLRGSGIRLYLASGTDVEDVRREAEAMGYAELFSGGIHGSVGDADRDPKRLVIEAILRGDGAGAGCAVFGDGPVEMREARKRGATAIGIASDERQRHGMNASKRSRLVLGGADAIIPDFSWGDELLAWLGWEA